MLISKYEFFFFEFCDKYFIQEHFLQCGSGLWAGCLLEVFHQQIVFISSSDSFYFIIRSFVFHLQTFFISASDFFPRTYNGLPAQMLWHFQLKFQNSINKNWANYSWHFVLKHCFYGIQINSAVHFNLIFLDSDVN